MQRVFGICKSSINSEFRKLGYTTNSPPGWRKRLKAILPQATSPELRKWTSRAKPERQTTRTECVQSEAAAPADTVPLPDSAQVPLSVPLFEDRRNELGNRFEAFEAFDAFDAFEPSDPDPSPFNFCL
jgi:hypothetical protein